MPRYLLDCEARRCRRETQRQQQLIGEMTIDGGTARVMTQQRVGGLLGRLLRGLAARSEGGETSTGMLIFCDQKDAGAGTRGGHAFDAYIDPCAKLSKQCGGTLGHAPRYVVWAGWLPPRGR